MSIVGKILLRVSVAAAGVVLLGTLLLMDKSYMPILAPVAVIGLVAWCVAGVIFWKRWSILLLPIFGLPFLPTAIWY